METSDKQQPSITAEEVISKLKEDGDFDKLRLKVIQKLKENEELRNNIISTVKQSATLGRAGAENLKPRELSDAIHVEVGKEVMRQVSDALWGVIRSSDGMKSEISETVESVYNSLLTPKVQEADDPTPGSNIIDSLAISVWEEERKLPYSEPAAKEETASSNKQKHGSINEGEDKEEALPDKRHTTKLKGMGNHDKQQQQVLLPSSNDDDPSVPPGFGTEKKCDVTDDDDPDVPPGFG